MQKSMSEVWDLQVINLLSTSKFGGSIIEVVTNITQIREVSP